jgi:hypothetical protein
MRLGIDRFSSEKPEPLLMSFRSSNGIEESDSGESPERRLINVSQDDVPWLSANSTYRSDTLRGDNQDKIAATSNNDHRPRSTTPRSSPRGSLDAKVKQSSSLSKSRVTARNRPHDERSHNTHSMAPSDERDRLRDEKKDSNVNDPPPPPSLPPPPPLSSSPMASPRQTFRQSAAVAAAVRSKNQGFNSTISMFEAKPKNPIVPPSDTWQNSGGLKTGILIGSPTRLGRRPMTPTKQIPRINSAASSEVDI